MQNGFNFDNLLDALAELVAAKARAELGQAEGMKTVCSNRGSQ